MKKQGHAKNSYSFLSDAQEAKDSKDIFREECEKLWKRLLQRTLFPSLKICSGEGRSPQGTKLSVQKYILKEKTQVEECEWVET